MNKLICTGNLGKDAEVKQVGGSTVANFSVAAKSGYGENEQTIWLDCALWGKRAEGNLVEYLKKGKQVCVSGEMGTREYNEKTYITLRVDDLTLVGSREKSEANPAPPADDMGDSSIPF